MKKKQSQKLLLHKSTVSNLTVIRGGADDTYPTSKCKTKDDTCQRSCEQIVSCLHRCDSYPDGATSCYTDPRPIGGEVVPTG
jgi:hypothetical protein